MADAVRTLLGGAVDYAGLFPPAQLGMRAAVENYAAYRSSADAWMLGRFVVPSARLTEFGSAVRFLEAAPAAPLPLSVLVDHPQADLDAAIAFTSATEFAQCDAAEARAVSERDVRAVAEAVRGTPIRAFIEVPIADDPSPLIEAIAAHGLSAKIRTGGVVAAAIPRAADVARFIVACVRRRVMFKATAGLHHTIRAEYPLTYAVDSPRATMFGYLNVFLAAALLTSGASERDAVAMLEETDPRSIVISGDVLSWRHVRFSASSFATLRSSYLAGFGSCSFTEPVAELTALHAHDAH